MNFADRVKETTTSTSAAVIVLGGAAATFRSFASSLAVGDTKIPVSMDDGNGNWENGEYTLTNPTTLTRTAIYASSNDGAPTVFPAGLKEVFCTLASEALNDLIDGLRSEISAGGGSGVRDIAFATTVPLSVAGDSYMTQSTVTGPLTFTPAAAAVRGALVYLRLIADGVNVPSFSAFKEWGGSLGYDNRAGIANQVQFFCDGADNFVSISQAVGAVPAPVEATAVTMSGPTGGVVNVASTAFTVGTNSARIASVTVTPTAVAGVTFSPASITLPSGSSTATFTATPTTAGAKTIAVTNSGGLTNPAAITYTVTAAATAPGAPTIGTATAGDGYVDVAFTAPASNGGSAITGYTATLSTGETATGTASPIRVTAANDTARTANVRATNGFGQGPASAESNSVTPTAPAVAPRLTALNAMTESASAPYEYTGTNAGAAGFLTKGGILNLKLPNGGDGSFALRNTSLREFIIAVTSSSSPTSVQTFSTCPYAFWTGSTGGSYSVFSAGAAQTVLNTVAPQANDIMRMRRSGTTLTAEVARAASPTTFTPIFTWTGVTTGLMALEVNALACTFDSLVCVGMT